MRSRRRDGGQKIECNNRTPRASIPLAHELAVRKRDLVGSAPRAGNSISHFARRKKSGGSRRRWSPIHSTRGGNHDRLSNGDCGSVDRQLTVMASSGSPSMSARDLPSWNRVVPVPSVGGRAGTSGVTLADARCARDRHHASITDARRQRKADQFAAVKHRARFGCVIPTTLAPLPIARAQALAA